MHGKPDLQSHRLGYEQLMAIVCGIMAGYLAFSTDGQVTQSGLTITVRLALCLLSGFLCYRLHRKWLPGVAIICGLVILACNPVSGYFAGRIGMIVIDIIAGVILLMVYSHIDSVSDKRAVVNEATLTQTIARSINKAIADGTLDEQLRTRPDREVTTPEYQPPSATRTGQQANPTIVEEKEIHFVMTGPIHDPRITGVARATVDANGKRGTTMQIFKGADVITTFELATAIYWHKQMEDGSLTRDQLMSWLRHAEQCTGYHYSSFLELKRDPEMNLMVALTTISIHYLLAYYDLLEIPETVKIALHVDIPGSLRSKRVRDFQHGQNMRAKLRSSDFDVEFLSHIRASFMGKRLQADG